MKDHLRPRKDQDMEAARRRLSAELAATRPITSDWTLPPPASSLAALLRFTMPLALPCRPLSALAVLS
jgi:hypothetical protein